MLAGGRSRRNQRRYASREWRGPSRSTITLSLLPLDEQDLQAEVLRLRRRVEKLRAAARILVAGLRALNVDQGQHRRILRPGKRPQSRADRRDPSHRQDGPAFSSHLSTRER